MSLSIFSSLFPASKDLNNHATYIKLFDRLPFQFDHSKEPPRTTVFSFTLLLLLLRADPFARRPGKCRKRKAPVIMAGRKGCMISHRKHRRVTLRICSVVTLWVSFFWIMEHKVFSQRQNCFCFSYSTPRRREHLPSPPFTLKKTEVRGATQKVNRAFTAGDFYS